MQRLTGIPGRFEAIDEGQPFAVIVDYAHTPDALDIVLRAARELGPGRLICVFGAGGDRDRGKRPVMGAVAAQRADLAIVTSDNPRSEDPLAIIQDVLQGAGTGVEIDPDRRSAIRRAVALAEAGDTVVVAGKGHEQGQETGGVIEPFDDRLVVREALRDAAASTRVRAPGPMIPVGWDEIAALELGRLERPEGGQGPEPDHGDQGRLPGRRTGRPLRGAQHRRGVRRRGGRPGRCHPRPRGPGSCPGRPRLARALEELGACRRRRRLDRQDLDQGHPRRALQRGHHDGLGGGEPEQRDRVASDGLQARGADTGARDGDGDARSRPDRSAVRRGPPDVVVVTSIGPEHLELVGTVERVAEANAEAIAALPPGGIAVVPGDAPELLPHLQRDDIEIRRFDRTRSKATGTRGRFRSPAPTVELTLPFPSRHMAENTLAALVAYDALGLPVEQAQAGADAIVLSRWRGEEAPFPGGGIVINDAYNANPVSMRAALLDLVERAGTRRRVAILGEMAELGDGSPRYHEEVGSLAARSSGSSSSSRSERGRAATSAAPSPRPALGPGCGSIRRRRRGAAPRRRDPRQGVARGGARRHRRIDRETGKGMVRVLIAGLVAMVLAIVVGPTFIEWLRRTGVGQQIREEGPARHIVKQGTPTMGGLLILATAITPFLVLSLYTLPGLALLFVTLGCAAIGFTDDYLKVRKQRSLGLNGRWKMLGLVLITIGVGWVVTQVGYLDTEIYFPVVDVNIDLHWLYFPFLFIVIAGTANGVNLTDGLDGLAAGTCAISILTFLAIAAISWIRSGDVGARSDNFLDVAIFAAALIGGVIGFLWFNAFPAEVFMGDTGSMALGGAIAALAVLTQTEVLLVFIGAIYLIEALSVMIQVASFKRTGKRVFLMAPIHHHFEMKAWSETKIMVRFWIVGAIFCTLGFVLYYRYYLRFKL